MNPVYLTAAPLLGLVSFAFLNMFSWAYAVAYGLLHMATFVLFGRRRLEAAAVVGLGAVLTWSVIFLTGRALPGMENELYSPMATAGFPFTAFAYPHSAMGGDIPPLMQWLWFFFDMAIWTLVAALAMPPLLRRVTQPDRVMGLLVVAGALMSLYGLGDTLLRFD